MLNNVLQMPKEPTRKDLRKELIKDNISPHHLDWSRMDEAVLEEIIAASELSPGTTLDIFIKYNSRLSHYGYWYMLGLLWNSFAGPRNDEGRLNEWMKLFGHNRPKRNACLMKPDEATQLRNLPKKVKVYWDSKRKTGISYRIEKATLPVEPFNPKDYEAYAEIDRENIIALFNRRGETELIILNPR